MRDREAVRDRLTKVEGIRPVLPVTLPLGYEYARDYDYMSSPESDPASASFDGTTPEQVESWSVFFWPKDGASGDGLPVVVFCVQASNIRDVLCPEQVDATRLRRRHGQIDVAISRVSVGHRDMAAWNAVDLTTDLDKVTWLR
jgi:hypothetical protein